MAMDRKKMEALVSDEFKRRLDAAAERAHARRVAASAEQGNNSTAEQRWANTLQAATRVWENRIRPAIGHAITQANQAIVHDEKMLSIQDGAAAHYAAATGINTELPYADVVAGPLAKSRAPQVAGVLTTPQPKRSLGTAQRLRFAMRDNGAVEMTAHDCDVARIPAMPIDQFTDEQIEAAIADFVDVLIPK